MLLLRGINAVDVGTDRISRSHGHRLQDDRALQLRNVESTSPFGGVVAVALKDLPVQVYVIDDVKLGMSASVIRTCTA